jgi:hypothetical protein
MGLPTWEEVFKDAQLGDIRRNARLKETAEQIEHVTEKKGASAALRGHAELKAVSRAARAAGVTPKGIVEGFIQHTCEEINNPHVLVIEDTTELNFAWRKKRIKGLGPTGNGIDQGFFLHPAIVVEPEKKMLLGLAGIEVIVRDYDKRTTEGDAHKYKDIEKKESYKWISVPREGCGKIAEEVRKTIVADREADIYDLFLIHSKGELGKNIELLIRASRNRKINEGEGYLFDEIPGWEIKRTYKINVEASKKRSARTAECEIRFGKVTIEIPKTQEYKKGKKSIPDIYVVDVREADPPLGEEAVHWTLLTTWQVRTAEEAIEKIEWYRCRWYIEEVFRVLKSGFEAESVRFDDGHSLMNWCALRFIMAVKVMYLRTHREDETPDSAKEAFSNIELEVLEACEGDLIPLKSTIRRPPKGTNAWAALLVALLGGYKVSPSAKPFGHVMLWRGLSRLEGAVIGYRAALKNVGRS